jgi:hypothetical protein
MKVHVTVAEMPPLLAKNTYKHTYIINRIKVHVPVAETPAVLAKKIKKIKKNKGTRARG